MFTNFKKNKTLVISNIATLSDYRKKECTEEAASIVLILVLQLDQQSNLVPHKWTLTQNNNTNQFCTVLHQDSRVQ